MAIPKVIHYCWFGGKPLPKTVQKCLKSWEKFCPGYKIRLWNEENFDMSCIPYVREMAVKKQWAFLTDYARLKIVYDQGGVYLDTDVQLLKTLDGLLEKGAFMGFEHSGMVATGLGFGAEAGHPFLKENMAWYEDLRDFEKLRACPHITTELLENHGLVRNPARTQTVAGLTVYNTRYLCPKNERTGLTKIWKETVSIHHYDASWFEASWQEARKKRYRWEKWDPILHIPNRALRGILGEKRYEILKAILKGKQ